MAGVVQCERHVLRRGPDRAIRDGADPKPRGPLRESGGQWWILGSVGWWRRGGRAGADSQRRVGKTPVGEHVLVEGDIGREVRCAGRFAWSEDIVLSAGKLTRPGICFGAGER